LKLKENTGQLLILARLTCFLRGRERKGGGEKKI
jgi:hypothetical protein